jgi:hypothetical protein
MRLGDGVTKIASKGVVIHIQVNKALLLARRQLRTAGIQLRQVIPEPFRIGAFHFVRLLEQAIERQGGAVDWEG